MTIDRSDRKTMIDALELSHYLNDNFSVLSSFFKIYVKSNKQ